MVWDITSCILVYIQRTFRPWFRQMVAGISLKSPRFSPTPVHVGFLVDKFRWGGFSNDYFDVPCRAISVGDPCSFIYPKPALYILSC